MIKIQNTKPYPACSEFIEGSPSTKLGINSVEGIVLNIRHLDLEFVPKISFHLKWCPKSA
jgi:hypothetical protein